MAAGNITMNYRYGHKVHAKNRFYSVARKNRCVKFDFIVTRKNRNAVFEYMYIVTRNGKNQFVIRLYRHSIISSLWADFGAIPIYRHDDIIESALYTRSDSYG